MRRQTTPLVFVFVGWTLSNSSCCQALSTAITKVSPSCITLTVPPAISNDDHEGYPSVLHQIHVVESLLTPDEAQHACGLSHEYAAQTGRWTAPDDERHVSYPTCDFPVDDCEALETYLQTTIGFDERLFGHFSSLYGLDVDDLEYLDLFVAHYQAKPTNENDNASSGGTIMDRLELHRDGSLLSFSLLLNDPKEFTGGGTFYDALRDVVPDSDSRAADILHEGGAIRPLKAGDACLHCGKLLHGADVVTSGHRTVLVGFVDVKSRNIRPGVLAQACTDWGRMDVAAFRYQRQSRKNHQGWTLHNRKFLPQVESPSYIRGVAPAFSSVLRRADPDFQRQKKLEAEDILLRTILLPPEERAKKIDWNSLEDGSITIL